MTLMEKFDFDTVLFPFNWAYWLNARQGEKVLKKAQSRQMGIIAMKALAHRKWEENEERSYPKCWYKPIFDDPELADLALRFTLSQPVSVALSPGDVRMLRLGMDIADRFTPLTDAELAKLRERALKTEPIFPHRD